MSRMGMKQSPVVLQAPRADGGALLPPASSLSPQSSRVLSGPSNQTSQPSATAAAKRRRQRRRTALRAVRKTLNQPVKPLTPGGACALSGFLTMALAASVSLLENPMPMEEEFARILWRGAGFLFVAAIVLQRREAGLWPFRVAAGQVSAVQVLRPIVKGIFCLLFPTLGLLFLLSLIQSLFR